MILTKDKGQRMWGGYGGSTFNGGSGGSGGGGGVSSAWVDGNYVSKDFFNQIFAVRIVTTVSVVDDQGDPVGDPTVTTSVVTPNTIPEGSVVTDEETGYVTTTTVEIESVQVLGGVWTNSYVSALGQNSAGGGGGGGSSTLAGLLDVAIQSPADGQLLIYNGTTQKWYNGMAVDIQSPEDGEVLMYDGTSHKWYNGIAGSVSLNEPLASINNAGLSAHPSSSGMTVVWNGSTWVYGTAGGGGSTAWSDITGKPTTISGYGITDAYISSGTITLGSNSITPLTSSAISDMATMTWVGQQGFLTSVAFSDITGKPTTLSGYGITDALSNATTFWGRTAVNGAVTGNLNLGGYGNKMVFVENNSSPYTYMTAYNDTTYNHQYIAIAINGQETFSFASNQFYAAAGIKTEEHLDIGPFRLLYDSTNEALKLMRTDSYSNGAHFYATGGVSSLGMSASGSGGGSVSLNEPLASINNAGLSAHPSSSGMTVVWNGSTWVYGTAGGGGSTAWSDITGKPTTISGYGITDAYISSGTITLGSNSITPLTSSAISDMATMTWVGQQGYTSNLGTVTSITAGTGLSGGTITNSGTISISSAYRSYIADGETAYGWGNHANAGYLTGIDSVMVTSALGYTPVSNTVTFWGQTVNGGVVSGAMTGVGSLKATGVIKTSSANAFRLTYGTASVPGVILRSDETMFYVLFTNPGQQDTGAYNALRPLYINKTTGLVQMDEGLYLEGSFTSATNYKGIRIGDGLITWDSTNQALKVEQIKKVNNVDTMVAGSIYATGSVSALGFGTNQAGSITIADLTVNTLMVTDTDFMLSKQKIVAGSSAKNYLSITGKDGVLINYNENNSFNARFWTMNPASNVYYSCLDIKYLYLANNVFLYYEDNNVKLSINGSTYTLIKS